MKLTVWTYEGPTHIGAMRVATGLSDVHLVLHAPQGDTYADLLFTMIERRDRRPPVTYTTFKARDLGGDTAELFKTAARDAYQRFSPNALLVGASCTAELIQDDPGGLAQTIDLPVPVINLDLPSYSKRENWAASETFYQIVRQLADRDVRPAARDGRAPTCNILGPTALGFRHRDDVAEIRGLLERMGIKVVLVAPMGASVAQLRTIGAADFNVLLYPETGDSTAKWLEKTFGQPCVRTVPLGYQATREFIAEVGRVANVDPSPLLAHDPCRMPWWSKSVDSNYLTGKRVFLFGDATHVICGARIAAEELGFEVVGLGSYSREYARELRAAAASYGVEALITEDYLEVEARIAELRPELVLGTQMERHIAKRLGISCAVISSPVHVQDFPARTSPQMGFEGSNVIFDTWIHPLVMGLEEHLLTMFRDDFEFHDEAGASHLGHLSRRAAPRHDSPREAASDASAVTTAETPDETDNVIWLREAEEELKKIPFFVRGKARRNTEMFAADRGISQISIGTLYEAKAHYAR